MLCHWITQGNGKNLGITTTILPPEPAENRLRIEHDRPIGWTAVAVARACVSDPNDPELAALQMGELLSTFDERGMGQIRHLVLRTMRTQRTMTAILDIVSAKGASRAMRAETELKKAANVRIQRKSGGSF